VNGRNALCSNSGSNSDGISDDGDPAHNTYQGEFTYLGDMPASITFVPNTMEFREATKEEAAATVTPEPVDGKSLRAFMVYNEAGAFEVPLE